MTVSNKDNPLKVGDTIQIAGQEVEIVCVYNVEQSNHGDNRQKTIYNKNGRQIGCTEFANKAACHYYCIFQRCRDCRDSCPSKTDAEYGGDGDHKRAMTTGFEKIPAVRRENTACRQ